MDPSEHYTKAAKARGKMMVRLDTEASPVEDLPGRRF